ncbi:MAG: cytochrome c biogenesis protein CcsA [Flavobacteriaceae bacterium]
MLKKITDIIFSTRLMAVAILAFAIAMAVATFVEDYYDTATSKVLVYNTWWFELIMIILVINFIGNLFRYRLFRREKWPVFLFHIAFIVTLLGAFVTRYHGFEGLMLVREGAVSDTILSDKTYINLRVDNGKNQRSYDKSVLFGQVGNPSYHLKERFGIVTSPLKTFFGLEEDKRIPFTVKMDKFIPTTKDYFIDNKTGTDFLHLVESSSGTRNDIYLKDKEIKNIDGILFSFNNYVEGGMNFSNTNGVAVFKPVFDGTFMEMQSQKLTAVIKDSVAPLQFLKLYTFNEFRFVTKGIVKGELITKTAPKKERLGLYDALSFTIKVGDKEEKVNLKGAKYSILRPKKISLNGLNFHLSYGSKVLKTPFSIKLRDFEMERYPGTNSPSSYASEVTVIDKDAHNFNFRIFMNHVLDYKGYRFFQSSFDTDEKGTRLSVNHDFWGTLITYFGYLLMGIGMFFTLFWNGSRFKDLSDKLKKISAKKATTLLLILFSVVTFAQEEKHNHSKETIEKTPEELQKISVSKAHADKFGQLLIQDFGGRFKPVNTYALEALRKVYGKDTYKGLSAEQVLLSAQLMPMLWDREAIIHAKEERLGSKIVSDLKIKKTYTSLNNFYPNKTYYLQNKVEESYRKNNVLRTYTDKEIINLDEKVNVWAKLISGRLMTIYPKAGDTNNKWYAGIDRDAFVKQDTMIIKLHSIYMRFLYNAIQTNDYKEADEYLSHIANYQKKLGASIIPSDKKIDLEIKYNRWNIFLKLLIIYFNLGLVLIVLAFIDLFEPNNKIVKIITNIFITLSIIGAVAHTFGLGLRWYLSDHAPWSNGYEATVFIALITVVAGLIFSYKRSKFVIAVAVLFAGFLLGIAHGSLMSPEMTNLVPVLKSYWLMIHVAIITASYAFLGLASLLGFIVLLLFIMRTPSNKKRFNETIKELTYVNESTMIVGLFMLSIGTFLGGVWANESWGRYWSWDPKEVWALISMMVYIFILHMRMVPGLQSRFAFNFASMISISTLIMTYFGVNYYLSGMHSYATGDPVPFPDWGIIAIVFFTIFSIFSFWKFQKFKKK